MRPFFFSHMKKCMYCDASPLLDLSQGELAFEMGQGEHQKKVLVS